MLYVDDQAPYIRAQIWTSSSALIVRLVGGLAVNVLGGIALARLLGPSIWGIYAISLFLLLTYQSLFEKGLVAYLIQKVEGPTLEEKQVAYTIQIILGFLCLAITALFFAPLAERWFGYPELFPLFVSVGVAGLAYALRSVPMALLERDMQYLQVGFIEISDIFSFNLVSVGLVLLGFGIQGLVVGNIARGVVSALLAVALREKPKIRWNRQIARQLLNFGMPVFGSDLVRIFGSAAEPILLGTLAGPQALAFVQVTTTLLNYPAAAADVLTRVSFSALSRVQDHVELLTDLSSTNVRVLARLLIPASTGLAATALIWVPWVYGSAWLPLAQTLLVAALPMAAGHVLFSLTAPLYARGRVDGVMRFMFLYNLTYWIACLVFIPRFAQLGPPFAFWVCAPFWLLLFREYTRYCGALDTGTFVHILALGALAMIVLFLTIVFHNWFLFFLLLIGFLIWWFAISRGIIAASIPLILQLFRVRTRTN